MNLYYGRCHCALCLGIWDTCMKFQGWKENLCYPWVVIQSSIKTNKFIQILGCPQCGDLRWAEIIPQFNMFCEWHVLSYTKLTHVQTQIFLVYRDEMDNHIFPSVFRRHPFSKYFIHSSITSPKKSQAKRSFKKHICTLRGGSLER